MDYSSMNDSRRRFLKGTMIAISATAIGPNVFLPAFAGPIAVDLDKYKPFFFDDAEWKFILAATDRLIPADETGPGAIETNVPVFIDLQMMGSFGKASDWYMQPPFALDAAPEMGYQFPLTPADTYRKGIAGTQTYCHKTFAKPFEELSIEQQERVLKLLESGSINFADVNAKQFFTFLLQNTKEGYFADPIHGGNKHMAAWKMIGFPGARGSYLEWVDKHNAVYPLGPVSIEGERG